MTKLLQIAIVGLLCLALIQADFIHLPIQRGPSPNQLRRMLATRKGTRRLSEVDPHQMLVMGNVNGYYYYFTYISVGTPPQLFTNILDTGSPLLVIPGPNCANCGTHLDDPYKPGSSSTASQCQCHTNECGGQCGFQISYSEGSSLRGDYYKDKICMGRYDFCPANEYMSFPVGAATTMTNLFRTQDADGIIGLSNADNNILGSIRQHYGQLDNKTYHDTFALCFGAEGGSWVVGGYNAAIHTGDLVWVPAGHRGWDSFYHIDISSISVNGEKVSGSFAAFVDSGTTFTYLSKSIADPIFAKFTSTVCKDGTATCHTIRDMFCLAPVSGEADAAWFAKLPPIEVAAGGTKPLVWHPSAYLSVIDQGYQCIGIVSQGGSAIFGMTFIMNSDVIFDREQKRMGMAPANCKYTTPTVGGGGSNPTPSPTPKASTCEDLGCSGHGYCESEKCSCQEGYTGQYCEIVKPSSCNRATCHNHGECNESTYTPGGKINVFSCVCDAGYEGSKCTIATGGNSQPTKSGDLPGYWLAIIAFLGVGGILLCCIGAARCTGTSTKGTKQEMTTLVDEDGNIRNDDEDTEDAEAYTDTIDQVENSLGDEDVKMDI